MLSGTSPGSPASYWVIVECASLQKHSSKQTSKKCELIEARVVKPAVLHWGRKLVAHLQAAQQLTQQAFNLFIYV